MERKTLSKPVQYALDFFGMICVFAFVYAIGTCTKLSAQESPHESAHVAHEMNEARVDATDDATDAPTPAWTEREVLIAKLAINEASGREADTVAITLARRHWSVERLLRSHPRALSLEPRGSRPWIAGLNAELTRPEHWNEAVMPWEQGQAIWLRTLQTVRRTLENGGRCEGGAPHVWGGRTLDHEHIARLLDKGFRIVNCGSTANVFLRQERR